MEAPRVSVSWSKRGFDFSLAMLVLMALSPVLIVIALMVKLETDGPALVTRPQIGLNGHRFRLYRFRTGRYTEGGGVTSHMDARLTRIGRLLSLTHMDTMPFLINVLLGDMSFVGPRRHDEKRDRLFAQALPQYDERFRAPPGLTGLAQVRGYDGKVCARADMEKQLECDIEYIHTWTFWLDLQTLMRSLVVIFRHEDER